VQAEIDVSYAAARAGVPSALSFKTWARAALKAAKRSGELAIRIADEDEARALNQSFRAKDYVPNVLSFPSSQGQGHLGDVLICHPVVAREAAAQSKSVRAHHAHMTVHGVLHLCGFDHIERADAKRMEALETAVLAQLGFADPYRRE
jgi:probable rRNA maturation factor